VTQKLLEIATVSGEVIGRYCYAGVAAILLARPGSMSGLWLDCHHAPQVHAMCGSCRTSRQVWASWDGYSDLAVCIALLTLKGVWGDGPVKRSARVLHNIEVVPAHT